VVRPLGHAVRQEVSVVAVGPLVVVVVVVDNAVLAAGLGTKDAAETAACG
jgi:hypothetical protein